jgi:hypothetical protein
LVSLTRKTFEKETADMAGIKSALQSEASSLPQDKPIYVEARVEVRETQKKTFQCAGVNMQEVKDAVLAELSTFPQGAKTYIHVIMQVQPE